MAFFSTISVIGDGTNNIFSVPFPYIQQIDIHVYVSGIEVLGFTWLTASTIQLAQTGASLLGAVVTVTRKTPNVLPEVVFQNGGLDPGDLNLEVLQLLYIFQEERDYIDAFIAAVGPTPQELTAIIAPAGSVTVYQLVQALSNTGHFETFRVTLPADEASSVTAQWQHALFCSPGDALFNAVQTALGWAPNDGNMTNLLAIASLLPSGAFLVGTTKSPPGAVSIRQLTAAMNFVGIFETWRVTLPADEADPVARIWQHALFCVPGDALYLSIEAAMGYNSTQMSTLFAIAATEPF